MLSRLTAANFNCAARESRDCSPVWIVQYESRPPAARSKSPLNDGWGLVVTRLLLSALQVGVEYLEYQIGFLMALGSMVECAAAKPARVAVHRSAKLHRYPTLCERLGQIRKVRSKSFLA